MEQSPRTFEILVGEAIGPFRLGMTREQVREVARRELQLDVESAGPIAGLYYDVVGDSGLRVYYDENGHSKHVEACWGPVDQNDSVFTLFGADVSMTDTALIQLLEDRWPDVTSGHWGVVVPSAGFSASYWDNSSDGSFCAVSVSAPTNSELRAG